jgi:hypothetical protein
MKKRVRSDRETHFRVRNSRQVRPFPTADILHVWAAKTSKPAIGGRKVSKSHGIEGCAGGGNHTDTPPEWQNNCHPGIAFAASDGLVECNFRA